MKIKCPNPAHQDDTASFHQYENGWWCFGCGYSQTTVVGVPDLEGERYVEDIKPRIEYILSLPKQPIRGLSLHSDSDAYYLLWPNHDYYLRREWSVGAGASKYKGPSGHPRPLLWAARGTGSTLIVCEGEINALSLAETQVEVDIVSPGSANEFYSRKAERNLPLYAQYDTILLIADNDDAGAKACIELKSRLLRHTPNIYIQLVSNDCNDILVKYGKQALKEQIEQCLDLFCGLSAHTRTVRTSGKTHASVQKKGPGAYDVYRSNRALYPTGTRAGLLHIGRGEVVPGSSESTRRDGSGGQNAL